VQFGPVAYPSDQSLKTWVAELNPLGTCTAVLFANGTAINTATFTGTRHSSYNVGLDVDLAALGTQSAIDLKVVYTSIGGVLKHYNTNFETQPKPFGKRTWSIRYTKLGGASQVDMARFSELDIEVQGTATVTSIWDADGKTLPPTIHTIIGRQWLQRQSFPPGCWGCIFQQRLVANVPVKVWHSSMDMLRLGRKGVANITVPGTPFDA
jgi:hypothetical protein